MKTVDCRFRVFHPEYGLRESFRTYREAETYAGGQKDADELLIEDVMARPGMTALWGHTPGCERQYRGLRARPLPEGDIRHWSGGKTTDGE